MPRYNSKDGLEIVWYEEGLNQHYIKHISDKIQSEFGEGPFDEFESTNEILRYLFNGLLDQVKGILNAENSLAFYQDVQILHEQSNQITKNDNFEELFDQITKSEFVIYRRVLRFILEQACDKILFCKEPLVKARVRCLKYLEELIYVGQKLFSISNLMASQQIIEDSVELWFNEEGLYVLDYKHHYNQIIFELSKDLNSQIQHSIYDKTAYPGFSDALKKCFGLSPSEILYQINGEHKHTQQSQNEPYPEATGFDLESLINNLCENRKCSKENAEKVIHGLILDKSNKCSIEESIFKPQSLNRHFYRPFLKWFVTDGKVMIPMIIVSELSLENSLIQIATNGIGWKKYPEEWKIHCFQDYVQSKIEINDKVLEDELELVIKEHNIMYSRNVTHLKKHNSRHLDIDNEKCGEIDFIFVKNKTIYIADSKFLLARYDFNNWRNDYSSFETNKKNYNKTITKKVQFFEENRKLVSEHFQVETGNKELDISKYDIEPIFMINTPTFYMYNSEYKIYTIRDFEMFLNNKTPYPSFQIFEETEKGTNIINVNHPYFKKPDYIVFPSETDE